MSGCPYFGRPQPSNMRSYNRHPLCLACAERLTTMEHGWRHESDPMAVSASQDHPITDAHDGAVGCHYDVEMCPLCDECWSELSTSPPEFRGPPMTAGAEVLLDRARAAKEVAMIVSLALMAPGVDGDGAKALAILEDDYGPDVEAQDDELDCLTIGAQAIREAIAMKGGDHQ